MHADDDVYLNAGDSYDAPGVYYPKQAEPTEEELQARAAMVQSYPIMASVYEWFEMQIDGADSIQNIKMQSMTVNGVKYSREVSIEAQVLAFQLLKDMLIEKQAEFKTFAPESDDE
jgi:hypothetical protein